MMSFISLLPNLPYPLFAKEGDLFRGLLATSGRIDNKITHEKHLN